MADTSYDQEKFECYYYYLYYYSSLCLILFCLEKNNIHLPNLYTNNYTISYSIL